MTLPPGAPPVLPWVPHCVSVASCYSELGHQRITHCLVFFEESDICGISDTCAIPSKVKSLGHFADQNVHIVPKARNTYLTGFMLLEHCVNTLCLWASLYGK